MQVHEVLIGLQVGVILNRDHDAAHGLVDGVVQRDSLVGRDVAGHRLGAQFGDLLQDATFVLHVLLHGRDKIGNQIIAFLQDRIDRGERILHVVLLANQAVVHPEDDKQHNNDDTD